MLDNQRYLDAKTAAMLFSIKSNGSISQEHFQLLLNENHKTQSALYNLSLLPKNIAGETAGFNTLFPPEQKQKITTIASIIGMPKSTKTITSENMGESYLYYPWIVIPEEVSNFKEKAETNRGFNYEKLVLDTLNFQEDQYLELVKVLGSTPNFGGWSKPSIIFDRPAWGDLPMARALFLSGRINNKILLKCEEAFINHFDKDGYQNSIVIALATPKVCLQREGKRTTPGKIMNLCFLDILYDQYLRFHYELMNFSNTYGIARKFNFSTLDLSGKDIHQSLRLVSFFLRKLVI